MALTQGQKTIVTRAQSLGAGGQAVRLSDEACAYLVGVIVRDLGLQIHFPEVPATLPEVLQSQPAVTVEIAGHPVPNNIRTSSGPGCQLGCLLWVRGSSAQGASEVRTYSQHAGTAYHRPSWPARVASVRHHGPKAVGRFPAVEEVGIRHRQSSRGRKRAISSSPSSLQRSEVSPRARKRAPSDAGRTAKRVGR